MEHSPTPWAMNENSTIYSEVIDDVYGYQIAICDHPETDFPNEVVKANSKRIVECVNAMEGIEDPKKMRETWEVVKDLELDAYHKLKQEHDDLIRKVNTMNWFVDRVESYWYWSSRNGKNYVETTFWYNTFSLERKETTRKESSVYDSYKLPDWAKNITTHNKSLDVNNF